MEWKDLPDTSTPINASNLNLMKNDFVFASISSSIYFPSHASISNWQLEASSGDRISLITDEEDEYYGCFKVGDNVNHILILANITGEMQSTDTGTIQAGITINGETGRYNSNSTAKVAYAYMTGWGQGTAALIDVESVSSGDIIGITAHSTTAVVSTLGTNVAIIVLD